MCKREKAIGTRPHYLLHESNQYTGFPSLPQCHSPESGDSRCWSTWTGFVSGRRARIDALALGEAWVTSQSTLGFRFWGSP